MKLNGKYFYGNEISTYGQENGFLDYGTLAKAFDAVLCNDLLNATLEVGYWEKISGMVDNSEAIEELEEAIEGRESKIAELEEKASRVNHEADEESENYLLSLMDKIEELHEQVQLLEEEKEDLTRAEEEEKEVFQWYIVSDSGAEILTEINEIVYYNDALGLYLWGVTHWGTAWDYVLTDVTCNCCL